MMCFVPFSGKLSPTHSNVFFFFFFFGKPDFMAIRGYRKSSLKPSETNKISFT